jgi:hypothetical protein
MRTLRIPTSREEITPQLLADLIANLRKVCNLSGTGCTVNELPNGISIDVPIAPAGGFYARIIDPAAVSGGEGTWQSDQDYRCYQWVEVQRVNPDPAGSSPNPTDYPGRTDAGNPQPEEWQWTPVLSGRSSTLAYDPHNVDSGDNPRHIIINPAMEQNGSGSIAVS